MGWELHTVWKEKTGGDIKERQEALSKGRRSPNKTIFQLAMFTLITFQTHRALRNIFNSSLFNSLKENLLTRSHMNPSRMLPIFQIKINFKGFTLKSTTASLCNKASSFPALETVIISLRNLSPAEFLSPSAGHGLTSGVQWDMTALAALIYQFDRCTEHRSASSSSCFRAGHRLFCAFFWLWGPRLRIQSMTLKARRSQYVSRVEMVTPGSNWHQHARCSHFYTWLPAVQCCIPAPHVIIQAWSQDVVVGEIVGKGRITAALIVVEAYKATRFSSSL